MAGLINWRKVSPPGSNPDTNHLYVGVDPSDCKLYIKDDTGTVFKYLTSGDLATELADYDLSTVVDSKITNAINNLIAGAPATLDTLNELAAALADDANFAATIASNIATVQSDIDTHEANNSNPHSTTAAQVGAYTTTQTDTQISNAVSAHTSAGDPHPQYLTSAEGNAAYQPLDGDLTAIAAQTGAGFLVRTTTNTWATRSLTTAGGSGLSITNQDGVFGSPALTNTDKGSTAVATHEAASDPHPNYETTTELNTRDTNNRNRANHTGTQTVSTISDFNTTIGTSTQTAINLKYDASNPAGYQTAAQVTSTVSAASTTDRDRANHTGSQLSNTISDFADTVRSTVLTGLSTATNAVIDATDTVLSALGKLQKQLSDAVNNVNATLAVINGRLDVLEATDAEWNELITVGNLTSTSNVTLSNISGLSVNTIAGNSYYLEYTLLFQSAATTTGLAVSVGFTGAGTVNCVANIPVAIDGTAALFTGHIISSGDTVIGTGVQAANITYVANIKGVFICTGNGSVFPQFRSEVGGSQVTILANSVALVREF